MHVRHAEECLLRSGNVGLRNVLSVRLQYYRKSRAIVSIRTTTDNPHRLSPVTVFDD